MKNKAAQELVRIRNKKKGKKWRSENARNAANIRWAKVEALKAKFDAPELHQHNLG